MPIRPMTKEEIKAGLHRAAVVCIEKQDPQWWSINVTQKDGVFLAAHAYEDTRSGYTQYPDHAAAFLLFVREALE